MEVKKKYQIKWVSLITGGIGQGSAFDAYPSVARQMLANLREKYKGTMEHELVELKESESNE